MDLLTTIEAIQNSLRAGRFPNEAAVSFGVVSRLLENLGWPVYDTDTVWREYPVEGRRVDFALCAPPRRPKIFLEVKRVGQSEGGDRQLFEYAFHQGIPFLILTDGPEWSFYLPSEQGTYQERRVYKLDLIERDSKECAEMLNRYLSYDRVRSEQGLEAAQHDHRDARRIRVMEATLSTAWVDLIASQDSLLLDLIAEKVEVLCGYKPDLELCSRFLSEKAVRLAEAPLSAPPRAKVPNDRKGTPQTLHTADPVSSVAQIGFDFNGKFHGARSARDVMQEVLTLFSQRDSTFLERFVSRKHGTKRRYVSQNRMDLYPGRSDLSEVHAVEFVPGWWLGTNYSKRNIGEIIELACEVAQVQFNKDLRVNLG
ncbi:MAG: hypothetical protein H7Z16_03615 [Pyrinomonadaceae bacterium]|nr:hypothetical protein [Pyrinomonadaceae bacterium]